MHFARTNFRYGPAKRPDNLRLFGIRSVMYYRGGLGGFQNGHFGGRVFPPPGPVVDLLAAVGSKFKINISGRLADCSVPLFRM